MRQMMRSLLAVAAVTMAGASTGQAGYIIDTTGSWDGNINNGWLGSGQSVTVVSGFEKFKSIGFLFHSESFGRTFDFKLSTAMNGGTTLLTTSFVVHSGLNVIDINLTLTGGQKVWAEMDYRGFTGRTAYYIGSNQYSGGNSSFGAFNGQTNFSSLDHSFVAEFDTLEAVPAPPAVILAGFGLASMCGLGRFARRKPTVAVA